MKHEFLTYHEYLGVGTRERKSRYFLNHTRVNNIGRFAGGEWYNG